MALPRAMRRFVVAAHLQDGAITPAVVSRVHALGLRICAWTVNDEARAVELEALGVEWLITDQPMKILSDRRRSPETSRVLETDGRKSRSEKGKSS